MSANSTQRAEADACRDEKDEEARALGHELVWALDPDAHRRAREYFWHGVCEHCGAEVTAGACWSSCPGVRDARRVGCSGPGTAVLTEVEAARFGELVADAVARFGGSVGR